MVGFRKLYQIIMIFATIFARIGKDDSTFFTMKAKIYNGKIFV